MAGIITKVLETKATYDNMSEGLRTAFFHVNNDGEWHTRDMYGSAFYVSIDKRDRDWYILYGKDRGTSCELDFRRNENGEMVPYEYIVWNWADRVTYHRVF